MHAARAVHAGRAVGQTTSDGYPLNPEGVDTDVLMLLVWSAGCLDAAGIAAEDTVAVPT